MNILSHFRDTKGYKYRIKTKDMYVSMYAGKWMNDGEKMSST